MFNETQASYFSAPGKIIVIGDVHGDVQRFLQCLYATRCFNQNLEWIAQPQDTIVIQMGDQIDSLTRGGASTWEHLCDTEMIHLTDRLDKIARLNGGRVLSLLGNHEIMNVEGDFSYVSEHSKNTLPLERRRQLFKPGGNIARILAKRNILLKVGESLFCHGGILPHHLILISDNIHTINEIVRKFLKGVHISMQEFDILKALVLDMQGILWTRMYVELAEANQEILRSVIDDVLKRLKCKRIFVGHNTVPSIASIMDGKIYLTDAGLSRAYGTSAIQCVQIINPDTTSESIETVEVRMFDKI